MKIIAESIRMIERRFDIFPAKFDWRGRVYRVDAVNECKTITDTRGGQSITIDKGLGR
jgi:hypothetical protein